MIYSSGATHDREGDSNRTTITINSYPHVTLLSPNGGEILESGSIYPVEWEAPPNAVKFRLRYSIDNGATWLSVHSEPYVLGTIYSWTVPTLKKDEAQCLMKVMGYDSKSSLVSSDRSDAVFYLRGSNNHISHIQSDLSAYGVSGLN